MEQTREAFDERLYNIWATFLDDPTLTSTRTGSSIMSTKRLKDTGWVDVIQFGSTTVVQCDVAVQELVTKAVQDIVHAKDDTYAVTRDDIQDILSDLKMKVDEDLWLFYLYPPDFKYFDDIPYKIRQLSEPDKSALDALRSACTPADVDLGEVNVTDELAYGAFDGDKMVACASMYNWRGFADLGILVHPDYRQRGLGKAVVSSICRWMLDTEHVMIYRCISTNIGSARIAKSLGFTHYFHIEDFKVVDNA